MKDKNEAAILYVEDDFMSRDIMQVMLTRVLGWSNVTVFEDSADFAARVRALDPQPDLIMLDIHVEPHNGFEMLTMLRDLEAFKTVPVVALTASVMNEEVHKLKDAGFDGVLAKPVDQDTFPDLLERIRNGEKVWRIIE